MLTCKNCPNFYDSNCVTSYANRTSESPGDVIARVGRERFEEAESWVCGIAERLSLGEFSPVSLSTECHYGFTSQAEALGGAKVAKIHAV